MGNTILVVEDNTNNINTLVNILEIGGYQVSTAINGEIALKKAEKLPDLILLDIGLPGINGFKVCEKIKSNPKVQHIPIIFLTGEAKKTHNIVNGLDLGASDYITKPFVPKELLARVKTHLELKKSKDIIEEKSRELEEKNKELEEANATKDKLFSIIAHDLRGPIGSFEQLLKRTRSGLGQIDENTKEKFSVLENSANSINKSLENLLDKSQSQGGIIDCNPKYIKLKTIIDDNYELLRPNAKSKNIELFNEVVVDIAIYADEYMITTVFGHLISNAIESIAENGLITTSAGRKNGFAEVAVSGTVNGTKKEDKDVIIIEGEKNEDRSGSKEKSSDHGLIICKEFVEINGGEIWENRECGNGCQFIFTLPVGK